MILKVAGLGWFGVGLGVVELAWAWKWLEMAVFPQPGPRAPI